VLVTNHRNIQSQKALEAKVYIIHENDAWVAPLLEALSEQNIPYEQWFISEGLIDLQATPPQGVFYNRMSASSHTRDHRFAIELTGPLIAWLESHGRRVLNNRRATALEVRKFEQYIGLQKHGLQTPRTLAAVGIDNVREAAKKLDQWPLILKPNRGGTGRGVQLFQTPKSLNEHLESNEEYSLDGVTLVQEYIQPAHGVITRLEFIDGSFYYAVDVEVDGSFNLCPADVCQVGDAFCPAPGAETKKNKFRIRKDFSIPEIKACEAFLAESGMEVAAIEFVEDQRGKFFYDVNINTNYNQLAESENDNTLRGMWAIAQLLGQELALLKT
jgi:biotin carboxylase